MNLFIASLLLCFTLIYSNTLFARDFNIVAIGDTGKGDINQYRVGEALGDHCREINCEFALLLGDNFYQEGVTSANDVQFVTKFEEPYKDVHVPFYVALGNHDYGKNANDWKRGSYQIEYSKTNPKWVLPDYWYSMEYENTLFIVLDTSRLFHNKDTLKQTEFVKKTIAANKKKWIVVVAHHPYISNGKHGNAGKYDGVPIPPYSGSVIKKFVDELICPHADLFISGHDHSLQTLPGTKKCPKPLFVVSGGGASVRDDLKGKNPALFQKAVLGFTDLKFTDKQITVNHVNADGEVIHSAIIKK